MKTLFAIALFAVSSPALADNDGGGGGGGGGSYEPVSVCVNSARTTYYYFMQSETLEIYDWSSGRPRPVASLPMRLQADGGYLAVNNWFGPFRVYSDKILGADGEVIATCHRPGY